MARPITLFSGQWADLPFENFCDKAKAFGFEGIEVACLGDHLDLKNAATDAKYTEDYKNIIKNHNLKLLAIGTHLIGQCVTDPEDPRLGGVVPAAVAGKPDEIRKWAVQEMKYAAAAAKNLGVKIVTGFIGNPLQGFWYSCPPTTEQMILDAYANIIKYWSPIFDEFDKNQIKFAAEVHPSQIVFDNYSAERLLKEFKNRKTLGFNFNPANLIWQGVSPHLFIRDHYRQIIHVRMKDAAVSLDGRAGILGSYLPFGDVRRGWNFRSLGHGDVDFESIIRELNAINYKGPLSVEWEDSDMNREVGAKEACDFVKTVNFSPTDVAAEDAPKAE
ncbi:MAG: sugar phosphate isomerase/epimerase [Treponema sp.]|nr:sugar phosphate isomerase/epimerase [Treponema sp.]MCL2236898.1 sugar phosphate isomerase/epimerase [Treponema sp.]